MKSSRILCLATVLLALGSINPMQADERATDGFPSKSFFKTTGPGQSARFVFHELPDLRLLFCDRKTLKERIGRSVCVVDDVRTTLANDEQNAAKEIHIDKLISVGELLKKAGLEKWNGGQPQVRIVKRDAILQSPLQSDTASSKPDVDEFLKQKLEPGDFLIIAPKS